MSKITSDLKKLQSLVNTGISAEVYALMAEIKSGIDTDEEKAEFDAFIKDNINKLTAEVDELHATATKLYLGELGDMINLSYVAKKYFKKSRAWLSQRINGNLVNGTPAKFTEEELKVFNYALADMSKILGSQRLSY